MTPLPLEGQTALVTGGSKGFGLGIAAALKNAGATVFITGRGTDALNAAAQEHALTAIQADATSPTDWDRVLKTITDNTGRLDILINNAGGGGKIAATEEQTDETIATTIALNLTGVIYGCRRAVPLLKAQGTGTIVNLSSACANHAWPTWGVYSAAKAGLAQFSKSLYLELRPFGIRVTTLTPSWGSTDFDDAAGLGVRDAEVRAKCIHPSEIGKIVADLCTLPAHLCVQETILWPMVQEVSPL